MDLAAFDYELPGELIAQEPLVDRAGARSSAGRTADFAISPSFSAQGIAWF
jgi:S-adenosylmethionine:tRNA-ribosyltransferase-isomerase (queuine synthetase)